MYELQTTNTTAITTTEPLQRAMSLLDDFISYIDRGEKTTATYLTNLRQFFAWQLYTGRTSPLTRQDIIAYRQYLTEEHDAIKLDPTAPQGWTYRTDSAGDPVKVTCSANTVKQYLQSVRQLFAWAAAEGLYTTNIAANIHAPKVKQDAHKKDALTADDVLTIEQSIDRSTETGKRLFAMYLLAVNAGMRTVELSRANIKDIERRNGKAVIYIYGKGRSEADQRKPLAPQVYDAIQDYLKSRTDKPTKDSPLFTSTSNRSKGKRIAATTISTMLKRTMQAAGYDTPKITPHSLRHTAGNNVMELTGRNLFVTQQYMRHASPATTEIYLHQDTERQEADIAQRLYNKYHGDDPETGDSKHQLQTIIENMDAEQLQQLAGIAQSIAK